MSATEFLVKTKASIKPVHIDGWLYIGCAFFGAWTATFSSDAAYKYVEPNWLYWLKGFSESLGASCLAAKMYRSTQYSDSLKDKQSPSLPVTTMG